MKTMINGDGQIFRFNDQVAEVKASTGSFKFIPKSEYKTKVRDVRKVELEDLEKVKKEQKHRTKDNKKKK